MGLVHSVYSAVLTLPNKLNELRSADNLHRICQIGAVALHNYGIYLNLGVPVKTHLYFAFKCTGQFIDFTRILRTPSWWLNSVTLDTIDHTDATVNAIEDVLRDEKSKSLEGKVHRIAEFRRQGKHAEDSTLRLAIRASLDHVLADGKGYTESGFKEILAKEISNRLAVRIPLDPYYGKSDIQVHLDTLKMEKLLKPRTLLETALRITRTFTVVIVNMALLQEWKLVDFSNVISKLGLKPIFNSSFSGGITQSTLIFTSLLATYVLKTVETQLRLYEMKDVETKFLYGQMRKINKVEQKRYATWTALIAAANATLYTFGIFRLKNYVFYNYIALVKAAELIGELYFKPKSFKFVQSWEETNHNARRT